MRTKYHDKFVDWTDGKMLQEVIDDSTSRVDVLRNLGYNTKSNISRQKLNKAINTLGLDISHFHTQTERWDILPNVINECFCISDVLRAVGLMDYGSNHMTAKRAIERLKLDTSHFAKKKHKPKNKIPNDELFIKDSSTHRSVVRNRLLQEDIIPYRCAECDNEGIWKGKELTLQVEHKNGISNDHRLKNLEFLCPNCHSQTSTYGNRNRNISE